MSQTVLVDVNERVCTVTLNRPDKKNAFNNEQWVALADELRAADANPQVSVIVLTGAGKDFSAGMDLGDPAQPDEHGMFPFEYTCMALAELKKPLVGAAFGVAVGGGATILLHCDLLVIGKSLRFALPFARLGLVPEFGSTVLLPMLIGQRKAAELMYTAQTIDAPRVMELDLATELCNDSEVLNQAKGKAAEIAQWPSSSLQKIKRLMKAPYLQQLIEAIKEENRTLNGSVGSPENLEAISAFMEKRKPDFSQF